jgi:hypothetical protein
MINDINVIIGLILILVVIYVLYYQTKKTTDYFYFSDITTEMNTAIEKDLVSCFEIVVNDRFELVNYLNSDFVNKNETELIKKIKELMIPGLIIMTRFIRLYSLDYVCKNEISNAKIVRLSDLFFKQIRSLIIYHHAIFRVGNYNIGTLNINDDALFKEIVCLTKTKLLLNDQNILSDYDSIEYPDSINAQLLNTYPLYIYTQDIYNLIIKYAKKETTNYCSGVNLDNPNSLIPVYRMYPGGNIKQCNERNYPVPTPALKSSGSSSTSRTQTQNEPTRDRITMKNTIFSTFNDVKAPIYSETTKMYMSPASVISTRSGSGVQLFTPSTTQSPSTTQTPQTSTTSNYSGLFGDQDNSYYLLSDYETIDETEQQQSQSQNNYSILNMLQNSNYTDPMSDTNILEAGSGPSYLGSNRINRSLQRNYITDTSLSSPFYRSPNSQSRQTLFPFATPRPTIQNNRRLVEGGSHQYNSYVEFPSYKNINLENDTGNNNFFLPNIFIET